MDHGSSWIPGVPVLRHIFSPAAFIEAAIGELNGGDAVHRGMAVDGFSVACYGIYLYIHIIYILKNSHT